MIAVWSVFDGIIVVNFDKLMICVLFRQRPSAAGSIKVFFEDRGFGFVTPDDGGEDVFVRLKENQDLEGASQFDACTFDKKWDNRKGKYKGTNCTISKSEPLLDKQARALKLEKDWCDRLSLLYKQYREDENACKTAIMICQRDLASLHDKSDEFRELKQTQDNNYRSLKDLQDYYYKHKIRKMGQHLELIKIFRAGVNLAVDDASWQKK